MPTALTPELLSDLNIPSDPSISPDGRWMTATVAPAGKRDEQRVSAIWLAETSAATPARQLTSGLAEDSHARWAPDSRSLVFLSDRVKRGVKQLHLLALDGSEASALTDEPGGVSDAAWLADGKRVIYLAVDAEDHDERERRERERDDAHVYGAFWPRAKPVVLDIASGATRRLEIGARHVAALAPSPDGARVAFVLWGTPELDWLMRGGELAVAEVASGELTILAEPGFYSDDLVWSPNGAVLYLAGAAGPTSVSSSQLWAIAVGAGQRPELLGADTPFCIDTIARGADSDDLLANVATGTTSAICRWTGQRWERLSEYGGVLTGLSVSADGRTLAALGSTPDRSLEMVAGPPDGPLRTVSAFHTALEDVVVGPVEVMHWERAGFTLDGVLIFPPGASRAGGPLPAVIAIHGGPYGRWTNSYNGHRFGRWLAQLGYLVFMPNPRGGAGHGNDFASAVLHTVGNEDYLDIMAGVDQLVAQGLADPDRLGVGGWSQGGFMTAWIFGHTSRFNSGVMGAGVSEWGMMIATSDIPAYENLMGGGNPYESAGPHTFDAQSPISYLHNARTPTLIVHGEQDQRVPLSQGSFMHRGLLRYGVPTELVTYPREPHGIQERQHQIDLTRRIGAGWNREEMLNHGTAPEQRWAVMRERVLAMRALWTSPEAAFHGAHVDFDPVWQWPKPIQTPGPPVLIGGEGRRVLERVLDYGDGWAPNAGPGIAERIAELRQRASVLGRAAPTVTVMHAPEEIDAIARYEAAGANCCVFSLPSASVTDVEGILDTQAELILRYRAQR
jgi:dipeptidyl aminopeptidase/acylaminoacyl peptidase